MGRKKKEVFYSQPFDIGDMVSLRERCTLPVPDGSKMIEVKKNTICTVTDWQPGKTFDLTFKPKGRKKKEITVCISYGTSWMMLNLLDSVKDKTKGNNNV